MNTYYEDTVINVAYNFFSCIIEKKYDIISADYGVFFLYGAFIVYLQNAQKYYNTLVSIWKAFLH